MSIHAEYDATNLPLWRALVRNIPRGSIKGFQRGQRTVRYVTARTVANLLDSVIGPENWWDEYIPTKHGCICKLTIRFPGGNVVTKCDLGGNQGVQDPGDDDKSGFSDAFKRAACKFGICRVVYGEGVPEWARDQAKSPPPPRREPPPQRVPEAPRDVPVTFRGEAAQPTEREIRQPRGKSDGSQPGKVLYSRYIKDGPKTLAALMEFGDRNNYPRFMIKWNSDQCREAIEAVSSMGFDV